MCKVFVITARSLFRIVISLQTTTKFSEIPLGIITTHMNKETWGRGKKMKFWVKITKRDWPSEIDYYNVYFLLLLILWCKHVYKILRTFIFWLRCLFSIWNRCGGGGVAHASPSCELVQLCGLKLRWLRKEGKLAVLKTVVTCGRHQLTMEHPGSGFRIFLRLLKQKRSCSGLENREYGRRNKSRWLRDTLYQQNLAPT
jgi:hypothetical protein